MTASLAGWKVRRRLLGGVAVLGLAAALTGCDGGTSSGPAPKNVQDEIKAGQKAGVEEFMKNRPQRGGPGGPGGAAPGGPPGAPGAPPGPPPGAPK